MLFVFGLLLVTVALFLSDRVRLDVVALLVIVALSVSGTLTPQEAVAGFGNTVVVLIAGLFVVGEALVRTGVAAAIGSWLLNTAGAGTIALQIRLMVVVAVLSAFMSSTGAVAIFIPVAAGIARKTGVPPARLMLPMGYAALLGGTLTLIGTPPNLIVSQELADHGHEPFRFESFTPLGLILLAAGLVYLVFLAPRILGTRARRTAADTSPGRAIEDLLQAYEVQGHFEMLRVDADAALAGRTVRESGLKARFGLEAIAVQRSAQFGATEAVVADPDTVIRGGDLLLVMGSGQDSPAESLAGTGLTVLDETRLSRAMENEVGLVEVVVAPRSGLRNMTIVEAEIRTRHGLHVLGIRDAEGGRVADLRGHVLAFGDSLLLSGAWSDIERLGGGHGDFVVMALPEEWRDVAPSYRRAPLALGILALMVAAMVLELLPTVTVVLAAGVALVLTGCLDMKHAYRSVSWQSLVLIAGMLPMGTALAKTGGLAFLVEHLIAALGGVGPLGIMGVLFLLTALFSQFISNTATAVLIAPIAIGVAEGLGVSPRPLVMAVALGASSAFVTPVASPVNTLVLGPGGYRFADFVRVGLPLVFVVLALVLVFVPVFFPF